MKWVAKTEHANTAVHSQASVAVRAVLDTILSTQQSLPISSQAEPHGSVAAWNMFSPSNLSAFNDPTLEQILNTDLDNDFMDVEAGSVQ